jgi:hypothetical protein
MARPKLFGGEYKRNWKLRLKMETKNLVIPNKFDANRQTKEVGNKMGADWYNKTVMYTFKNMSVTCVKVKRLA